MLRVEDLVIASPTGKTPIKRRPSPETGVGKASGIRTSASSSDDEDSGEPLVKTQAPPVKMQIKSSAATHDVACSSGADSDGGRGNGATETDGTGDHRSCVTSSSEGSDSEAGKPVYTNGFYTLQNA